MGKLNCIIFEIFEDMKDFKVRVIFWVKILFYFCCYVVFVNKIDLGGVIDVKLEERNIGILKRYL